VGGLLWHSPTPFLARPGSHAQATVWVEAGRMPNLIHHTASRDRPPTPGVAKGEPLSERIASGKPCSLKAASKIGRTCSSPGRATA
jgi:hypothetical protein